jgi:hypothetical protein
VQPALIVSGDVTRIWPNLHLSRHVFTIWTYTNYVLTAYSRGHDSSTPDGHPPIGPDASTISRFSRQLAEKVRIPLHGPLQVAGLAMPPR